MNQINIVKGSMFIVTLVFIFSCSNQSIFQPQIAEDIRIPYAAEKNFLPQPIIIKAEEILSLSNEHKLALETYFKSKKNRSMLPNKRLSKYLEQYVKNYFYYNQTLTANQSLERSQGNCLSLAILTTAFAKHLSIDIGYQLVDSTPVYQEDNGIVLISEHLRSILYAPKRNIQNGIFFFAPATIAIDYFPERNIRVRRRVNEHEFLAMYYRNKAAESIIHKDNIMAYWLLRKALDFNPNDQVAINMLALVHQYHGLKKNAEALFKYGISRSEDKLNLLTNYHIFLQREKRFKDAHKISNQLKSYKTKNPFDWVKLGNSYLAQGKHSEAKRYFKRALKIAPYIHQAYFGIAKSEAVLGNHKAAKRALEKAKENSYERKNKELYQNKLLALMQES